MPEPSDVEEQLAEQQAAEEEKRQEFETLQQQERLNQQSPQQQAVRQAQDFAKQAAARAVRRYGAKIAGKVAARYGLTAAATAVAPFLLPVLVAVIGVLLMGLLVIVILVSACNAGGVGGKIARFLLVPGASTVCKYLSVNGTGGLSGGAGGGSFENLSIVLTSAYRPGAVVDEDPRKQSAHSRGEAFDIALINPAVGFRPNPPDSRIETVVSLAEGMGFVEPRGNVVDEYNNPSKGTRGPHIHVEFNAGHCPGPPQTAAPNDLVDLTGLVPMSGASPPQVRACLKPYVLQLFQLTGQNP